MRVLLVILCFIHLSGAAQRVGEWKSLPEPEVTDAFITTDAVKIYERTPKQEPFKAIVAYDDIKREFAGIVKPKVLPALNYTVHDLPAPALSKTIGSFIFKDNSTGNVKYLDQAHGLVSDDQNTIAHDEQGLIYFGGPSGVSVYNGNTISLYQYTDFFNFTNCHYLHCDRRGRVWVQTSQGLCYIKDNKVHVSDFGFKGRVDQIREDNYEGVWFCTYGEGAYLVKDEEVLQYHEGLTAKDISDAYRDKKNRLWLGELHHAASVLEGDSLFEYKGITVATFHERGNEMYIGTFRDKFRIVRNDSVFTLQLRSAGPYINTYSLCENSSGLWGNAYGKGVFLLKKDSTVIWFTEKNGGSHHSASEVLSDSYGNVWVGTYGAGVFRVDENVFYQNVTAGNNDAAWIDKDSVGNLWYFRNGGSLTKETATEYVHHTFSTLPHNLVYTAEGFITDTAVWMGNYNVGITQLQDGILTGYRVKQVQKDMDNNLWSVCRGTNGGVWSMTTKNTLVFLQDNKFYNYSESALAENTNFSAISTTKFGTVVVETDKNTVLLVRGDQYCELKLDDDLQGRIYCVQEITEGEYLVFAHEQCAIITKDGLQRTIDHPFLLGNEIKNAVEIGQDKYMIASARGFAFLDMSASEAVVDVYGAQHGRLLPDGGLVNYIDGKIHIAGNGLIYDSSFALDHSIAPMLSLNVFFVDTIANRCEWNEPLIEQDHTITFEFNKISWGRSSRLVYQLIRDGEPQDWQEQESNIISFEALANSNYELVVYVKDDYAQSKQLRYKFTVKPYWYQTWWALVLLLVAVAIGFVIYILYQRRRAIKTEQRLQGLVDEKTEALSDELSQKELLLKEVTHRVKNNMQMVSAILELQSFRAKDNSSKQALKEGISRINSLAMAHQNLYQNESFVHINLQEYLGLIVEYLVRDSKYKIEFDVPDNYLIDIEKAQALGFILNELLTNSIKYAWPGEVEEKQMKFSIVIEGDESIATYRDNGIGFKDGYNYENDRSLGNVLISSFVDRQLSGTLETMNDNGAKTTIKFSKDLGK